ncbi:MAG: Dipicolinate synthase subunit B [Dehalococcoidia bacterium]|nr:Dipicolinate synthase subunit B [Bacillota bacterium]MBT9143915.1 Dipicolinate synthase subunit B [Bacillota bacterium]
MRLKGKKIGFALTGSHCTLEKVFPELEKLLEEGAEVYPIISSSVDQTNSRFGEATEWKTLLVKKKQGKRLLRAFWQPSLWGQR